MNPAEFVAQLPLPHLAVATLFAVWRLIHIVGRDWTERRLARETPQSHRACRA